MAMHSSLVKAFDGCPVTILVGKSGRGKTQAMKLGMATIGTLEKFYVKSSSKEAILRQANLSSLGVFVDDLKEISGISDVSSISLVGLLSPPFRVVLNP